MKRHRLRFTDKRKAALRRPLKSNLGNRSGREQCAAATPICHEADTSEAKDHHRPCRGLGDCALMLLPITVPPLCAEGHRRSPKCGSILGLKPCTLLGRSSAFADRGTNMKQKKRRTRQTARKVGFHLKAKDFARKIAELRRLRDQVQSAEAALRSSSPQSTTH